jgi:hypothetical protein
MGYEYEDNAEDIDAPDIQAVDGACPPIKLRYRIFPSYDFNLIFSLPPENVDWRDD